MGKQNVQAKKVYGTLKKKLTGRVDIVFIFCSCFTLDDAKLASRVHAFLSRYGLVNFGVYKILKMPPSCKYHCFLVLSLLLIRAQNCA